MDDSKDELENGVEQRVVPFEEEAGLNIDHRDSQQAVRAWLCNEFDCLVERPAGKLSGVVHHHMARLLCPPHVGAVLLRHQIRQAIRAPLLVS